MGINTITCQAVGQQVIATDCYYFQWERCSFLYWTLCRPSPADAFGLAYPSGPTCPDSWVGKLQPPSCHFTFYNDRLSAFGKGVLTPIRAGAGAVPMPRSNAAGPTEALAFPVPTHNPEA